MASLHPKIQGSIFDKTQFQNTFDEDSHPVARLDESTMITFYGMPNPEKKVWSYDELETGEGEPFIWLGLRIAGEMFGIQKEMPSSAVLGTKVDDSTGYSVDNIFPAESILVIVSGPLVRWWHMSLKDTNPLLSDDKEIVNVQLGEITDPTVYQIRLRRVEGSSEKKYYFDGLFVTVNYIDIPVVVLDENAPDMTPAEFFEKIGVDPAAI